MVCDLISALIVCIGLWTVAFRRLHYSVYFEVNAFESQIRFIIDLLLYIQFYSSVQLGPWFTDRLSHIIVQCVHVVS